MTNRPATLESKTYRIKTGCSTLYITVSFKDNKVFEVFLNGSKSGGCRPNQEGIARLVSLALRHNEITEVIDQLELIQCPSCIREKSKLTTKEEQIAFPTSCPDAIAKVLRDTIQEKLL